MYCRIYWFRSISQLSTASIININKSRLIEANSTRRRLLSHFFLSLLCNLSFIFYLIFIWFTIFYVILNCDFLKIYTYVVVHPHIFYAFKTFNLYIFNLYTFLYWYFHLHYAKWCCECFYLSHHVFYLMTLAWSPSDHHMTAQRGNKCAICTEIIIEQYSS